MEKGILSLLAVSWCMAEVTQVVLNILLDRKSVV